MAGAGTSMLGSLLVFTVILSVQEIYRGKLASSELFTILGGFTSSLLFLFSLTESSGMKSDWGAGMLLLRKKLFLLCLEINTIEIGIVASLLIGWLLLYVYPNSVFRFRSLRT